MSDRFRNLKLRLEISICDLFCADIDLSRVESVDTFIENGKSGKASIVEVLSWLASDVRATQGIAPKVTAEEYFAMGHAYKKRGKLPATQINASMLWSAWNEFLHGTPRRQGRGLG